MTVTTNATPPPKRRFVQPMLNEDWDSIAARALPDVDRAQAIEDLKSWNMHLVMRRIAIVTPSDIIFVEPPKSSPPA